MLGDSRGMKAQSTTVVPQARRKAMRIYGDMCDIAIISDIGYQPLYTFIILACLHSNKLKYSILPTPYNLAMARKLANNNIADMLGGYRWIDDNIQMSSSKDFIDNKFNKIYIAI